MRTIAVHYDPKPTGYRGCDFCATYSDYTLGGPIGYGANLKEAIAALEWDAQVLIQQQVADAVRRQA